MIFLLNLEKQEVKMACSWKWTVIVLGIVILVFAWWMVAASQWIITIAAVLLIIHALIPHAHSDMKRRR